MSKFSLTSFVSSWVRRKLTSFSLTRSIVQGVVMPAFQQWKLFVREATKRNFTSNCTICHCMRTHVRAEIAAIVRLFWNSLLKCSIWSVFNFVGAAFKQKLPWNWLWLFMYLNIACARKTCPGLIDRKNRSSDACVTRLVREPVKEKLFARDYPHLTPLW
jgi:hypothetical protein